MSEKGSSLKWKRRIATVIAVIFITANVIVSANAQQQEDDNKHPARETVTERPTNALLESTKAIDGSINVDPATPDLLDTDQILPIRVKPEHPFYFISQYTQRFDDNVLLRKKANKSDLIYLPEIGFGAVRVRSRSLMRIDYLLGAEIHKRFSEFDGAIQTLNADWQYDLSKRITFFANDQFSQTPLATGLGLFGVTPDTGTAAALNVLTPTRAIDNDISAGFLFHLDKFSSLRASYGFTLLRFNNPELIDINAQLFELAYTKQVSRKRSYELTYRTSFYSGMGNLTTYTLQSSLIYRPNNRLRLQLGAGPQFAISSTNGSKPFLTALAELSYETPKTTYALNYNTGVGTGGGLAIVTHNQVIFGRISHIFGDKLETEFRLGNSRAQNSVIKTASPFPLKGSANNELIIECRADYAIANKFRVFFDYQHSNQSDSGTVAGDVIRNLISVGVNFDTRRPVRARF